MFASLPRVATGISVVIPTHARAGLLHEALESVFTQVTLPSEVLVVDDLGDRDTERVVSAVREGLPAGRRALRYIRNRTPGPSASRNLGARHAKGQFLAFLDDDDLWEPHYLERVNEFLQRERASVVITAQMRVVDGCVAAHHVMVEDVSLDTLFARNPGVRGSNIVISRELFFEVGGFDVELSRTEDKDLLFRLLLAGHTYAVLPGALGLYRLGTQPRLTQDPSLCWPFYHKHKGRVSPEARRKLGETIVRRERRQVDTFGDRVIVELRLLRNQPRLATRIPRALLRRIRRRLRAVRWRPE